MESCSSGWTIWGSTGTPSFSIMAMGFCRFMLIYRLLDVKVGDTVVHRTTSWQVRNHWFSWRRSPTLSASVLHGEQVNPTEWWDPFWVKTRIKDPLGLPSLVKASEIETEPEPASEELGPQPAPVP